MWTRIASVGRACDSSSTEGQATKQLVLVKKNCLWISWDQTRRLWPCALVYSRRLEVAGSTHVANTQTRCSIGYFIRDFVMGKGYLYLGVKFMGPIWSCPAHWVLYGLENGSKWTYIDIELALVFLHWPGTRARLHHFGHWNSYDSMNSLRSWNYHPESIHLIREV